MPNREPTPKNLEERITLEFAQDLAAVEDRLVADAGPPPDSKRMSEANEDRLWALRDPNVDGEALARQLVSTGVPQEELPALVIVQEFPDWAPIFGQPTESAETADQLARMAEFPYRWQLLVDLDYSERVKKSDRMNERYQKAMGSTMMMPMELGAGMPPPMPEAPQEMPAPVGGAPEEQIAAAPPGGFAGVGMGV